MKTVSVEIKIPDGHEVEEVSIVWPGYQFSPGDAVGQMVVKTKPAKPFLINGVPADWPEWLTCDWVAKDEDGEVYWYDLEPQIDHPAWFCNAGMHYLDKSLIAIDIPGPWEQSKRENPNRKNKGKSE